MLRSVDFLSLLNVILKYVGCKLEARLERSERQNVSTYSVLEADQPACSLKQQRLFSATIEF
jgi:hypothetical protein